MLYFTQCLQKFKGGHRETDEMPVWVNESASKPGDPSSIPRILLTEGGNGLPHLFSELWMHATARCRVEKSHKINFSILLNSPKGEKALHPTGNSGD